MFILALSTVNLVYKFLNCFLKSIMYFTGHTLEPSGVALWTPSLVLTTMSGGQGPLWEEMISSPPRNSTWPPLLLCSTCPRNCLSESESMLLSELITKLVSKGFVLYLRTYDPVNDEWLILKKFLFQDCIQTPRPMASWLTQLLPSSLVVLSLPRPSVSYQVHSSTGHWWRSSGQWMMLNHTLRGSISPLSLTLVESLTYLLQR